MRNWGNIRDVSSRAHGDDGNLNSDEIRASVLVVDLKSHDDVVSNDLSNDNSSSLVEGSSRGQEMSIESDIVNKDSSCSNNVDDNSSIGNSEESSR